MKMDDPSKEAIIYTLIEGLHKNPNESWEAYQDRFNLFKIIEKENKNIPSWAIKRANIIFLKEKRNYNKKERIENEERIRDNETLNEDNETKIKKDRRKRWKVRKEIEEKENKEIEDTIKDLYKDLLEIENQRNNIISLFEDNKEVLDRKNEKETLYLKNNNENKAYNKYIKPYLKK
jgi:hypothetical protein